MMIAILAWSLKGSHVKQGPRAIAFSLLDDLLRSCARTGELELLIQPELQPGQGLSGKGQEKDNFFWGGRARV